MAKESLFILRWSGHCTSRVGCTSIILSCPSESTTALRNAAIRHCKQLLQIDLSQCIFRRFMTIAYDVNGRKVHTVFMIPDLRALAERLPLKLHPQVAPTSQGCGSGLGDWHSTVLRWGGGAPDHFRLSRD